MFDPIQNQALYPVLQHYTGCKISSVSPEGDVFRFKTLMGDMGIVIEDISGDWSIIIEDEEVYRIEREIFNILIKPDKKSSLEDYIEILNDLSHSGEVSYRSKMLVSNILVFLEEYILSSDFLPKKNIRVGIFSVLNVGGKKFVNCLN
jgi:hypothetical protein